jgi:hypothetical protein
MHRNPQESAHVILDAPMKKLMRPALMILLSFILALFSAAMTHSVQATTFPSISGTTPFFQTTPTPQAPDQSEIGSTDEIVVMGGVIIFIIFMPILLARKSWR